MHKKLTLGLAISLCTQVVVAEDTPESPWTGEGKFGLILTSGNTENQNLSAGLALAYQLDSWKHGIDLNILRVEESSQRTADSYGLDLQSDYHLSKDNKKYLFGKFRYLKDRFGGYDYQTSLILGYGHRFFETKERGLDLRAGVGIGKHQIEVLDQSIEASSEMQPIGFFGLKYHQKIGAHSEFTQELKVEGGSDNVHSESETGFKVNIAGNLAMNLSLLVKNNSEVPSDKKKTDTITSVSLVYDF